MKMYEFEIPFSGMMKVWIAAENEEQAFDRLNSGDWEESQEISFESDPERGSLIAVEEN